jgi:EAL domain-containing protein (putative c-di-GMP-specific phosphodiesterase class I)
LRAHGANVIQGNLVASAMPAEAVTGFLEASWRFGALRAA